jgi:PAS domain S-box-containing protein
VTVRGPFDAALIATAAIALTIGVQQLMIAARLKERAQHLWLALAALGVGASAWLERKGYAATGPEEFFAFIRPNTTCIVVFLLSLCGFMWVRTGLVRRWLVAAIAVAALVTLVLEWVLPSGSYFAAPPTLEAIVLPWGETIHQPMGPAAWWRITGDVANLGFMVLLLDTLIRLHRRGRRREARLLGAALVAFSASMLLIIPIDLGLLRIPAVHTFSFLIIVAAVSWELSDSVAQAATLTREVTANERRWRQLLDDVQLLAVRVDRHGRVVEVNPHFTRVMGFTTEQSAGHRYWEFVAPEQREQRRAAFERAMAGEPTLEVEVEASTGSGERKRIVWRNVILRDASGRIEGMLSLGADITDRVAAEADRDRALADLERTVAQLDELRGRLEEENLYLKEEVDLRHEYEDIVGNSDALLYVLHRVERVAGSDATVLIQGESGVGKELVARTIHQRSRRATRPFTAVNCAAMAPTLVESELFGHEKGAFTGADRRRRGCFERADGGTLFLDEVGELPLEVQPKLLRVLQSGELERVGGSETLTADVRLIAATNRQLRSEVEVGSFREDLFYRLEVYPITVPPLRERREDVPLLVQHFARIIGERHRIPIEEIPQEVLRRLSAYDWPGNVRELMNVVERAVLTSTEGVLRLAEPLQAATSGNPSTQTTPSPLSTLREVESAHISAVLEACGGKIAGPGGAAEVLDLHPNTLRSRIKKLGLRRS